jgi:hypothetical protein
MVACDSLGFSRDELAGLNQFCIHQQVLFLSDILDASGKLVDQRCMHWREPDEIWSTIYFGRENPPNCNLRLWQTGLAAVLLVVTFNCLGRFINQSHKIWDWH